MAVTASASTTANEQHDFRFACNDVVLVKWDDGKLYYAKIKRIDRKTKKCMILFDDLSRGEAHFSQIHSGKERRNASPPRRAWDSPFLLRTKAITRCAVTETTTEIVCIVCKGEASEAPDEIVLCDKCGVGELHYRGRGPLQRRAYLIYAFEYTTRRARARARLIDRLSLSHRSRALTPSVRPHRVPSAVPLAQHSRHSAEGRRAVGVHLLPTNRTQSARLRVDESLRRVAASRLPRITSAAAAEEAKNT